MLQNIMAGFDILGVGVVLGSLALLWGFWKVLHDDLDLENASPHRTEPKPKSADKAGRVSTAEMTPTPAPRLSAPPVDPLSTPPVDGLDRPTAA